MPEQKKGRQDAKKGGSSTGNKSHSRTDMKLLESKLKKVTLGDEHKPAKSGGRVLPQPQVHRAAPQK